MSTVHLLIPEKATFAWQRTKTENDPSGVPGWHARTEGREGGSIRGRPSCCSRNMCRRRTVNTTRHSHVKSTPSAASLNGTWIYLPFKEVDCLQKKSRRLCAEITHSQLMPFQEVLAIFAEKSRHSKRPVFQILLEFLAGNSSEFLGDKSLLMASRLFCGFEG